MFTAPLVPVVASRSGRTHVLRVDGHTACGWPTTGAAGWAARPAAAQVDVDCLRCSHEPVEAPARAAAADAPRDEVTVPVTDEEDPDAVVLCLIVGHEMVDGSCEVCGQPDPEAIAVAVPLADTGGMELAPAPQLAAVAAVLADAAATGATLTSEPGGFGAALGVFGFGEGERGDSMSEGVYWAFDHETAAVRVVCYTSDGDRVALIGFDPARPAAKLVAWKASFDGSAPQHAVLTALAAALGLLPAGR